MAESYGRFYKHAYINEPPEKAFPGTQIGRISCLTEFVEWDVNGDPKKISITKPAVDDLIYLGHIPKGAIILRITSLAKAADASFAFSLGSLADPDMLAASVAASGTTPVHVLETAVPDAAFEPLEEDLLLMGKVTGVGANDASTVKLVVEYLAV